MVSYTGSELAAERRGGPMEPVQFTDFTSYPTLNDIMRHVALQFGDVRALMRLPMRKQGGSCSCPEIPEGGNFAAAAALCNLVSGLSVLLYEADRPPAGTRRRCRGTNRNKTNALGTGQRFKDVLVNYFPWDPSDPADCAKALYDWVRNPLAHALGVHDQRHLIISIAKDTLGDASIAELEQSRTRPSWCPPPIVRDANRYTINVWGLYWGTFEMVHRLAVDAEQMAKAEAQMKKPLR